MVELYLTSALILRTAHLHRTLDSARLARGYTQPASRRHPRSGILVGVSVSVSPLHHSPFTPLYWLLYANKYEILKYIFNLKMTIIKQGYRLYDARPRAIMLGDDKIQLVKFHNSNRVRWLRILLLVTIVGPRYTAAGNRGQLWVDLELLLFSSVTGNWSCSTGFVTHLNL